MHEKERGQRVPAAAVRAGRFLRRRKRLGIALVVVAPLLTGIGLELFLLNLLGLRIEALFIRSQVRRRRQEREHQRWLRRREREAEQTTG